MSKSNDAALAHTVLTHRQGMSDGIAWLYKELTTGTLTRGKSLSNLSLSEILEQHDKEWRATQAEREKGDEKDDKEMKYYVLGFLFNETSEKVLLMEKQKPAWQKGKLNGIGGKIEAGESAYMAMRRERKEEIFCKAVLHWQKVITMQSQDWRVVVFTSKVSTYQEASQVHSLEDEKVSWHYSENLPSNVIPNLHWLVPLCKYALNQKIDGSIWEDSNPVPH